MNFKETFDALKLTLRSGAVPLIIGESGIGKTALIHRYANEEGLPLVNIDANLLKEGEIGGLPLVEHGQTTYAVHHKLRALDEAIASGAKGCLLFIDEINRCDHAVQQELMNMILNREINGYRLDPKVLVCAAMNPSARMEDYENTRYQVVDMDPAQENRFVFFSMDSDAKEWIHWGLEVGEIDPRVISFISTFEDYLHSPTQEDYIEATPRGWERISNALKTMDEDNFSQRTLYHFVRGNVGAKIAGDFMGFLEDQATDFPKALDLLEADYLSSRQSQQVQEGTHSRLYVLALNLFKELALTLKDGQTSHSKVISAQARAQRIAEVLNLYPKDLRISLYKELKAMEDHGVYTTLREEEEFLKGFYDAYR